MSKNHEFRAATLARSDEGDGRTFTARAVTYNVVDEYRTRFVKGAFAKSLQKRMPRITWAHDWADLIGKVTEYDDRDDGLYVTARLSDPDAVPRARQAIAQLADGTLTDVSVGFMRRASSLPDEEGIVDITEGELDEIALTLRGAVPGATVLSARGGKVGIDAVVELAKRVAAGELTDDEAQAALRLLADEAPAAAADETPGEEPEQADTGAVDEALAGLDAALGRSRR